LHGNSHRLINPLYEHLSEDEFRLWDNCFSFPKLLVWLERSTNLCLLYQDENGSERRIEASGALSELIQHEMDHLDGILAIDRALDRNSFCTTVFARGRNGNLDI
jgi:peptide deformylase